MRPDGEKPREELIAELAGLRERCALLEQRCRAKDRELDRECAFRDRSEEALRLADIIIDRSPVILFRRLAGDDPRLVYVSPNIRQTGYSAEDFLEERVRFRDIVHPEDADRLGAEIRRYAEADTEEYTQHYRVITRSGETRWVEDQTSVVRDAAGRKVFYQGIVVDITARRQAEEALRKSEEKFRRIVETAGEGFLLMDDALRVVYANDACGRMLGYEREELIGKTPLDLASEPFRGFLAAHRERLLSMEHRRFEGTLLARDGRPVPVLIHGNTLRDDAGRPMGNVAFLADLTDQKKALDLAGKVQKSLIPAAAPKIRGLDIAGRSDACQEVGGDYFDFLYGPEYPSAKLKVVVGDVSGHGVDAALLMTSARAFIRLRAAQPGSPAEVVGTMNRDLALDMGASGHFMTLFLAEIDPADRSLCWVRAGHEPALLYGPREDRFEELLGRGVALGVDAGSVYREDRLPPLPPGTLLVLGTDGLWEARDPEGRAFGKERFRRVLRSSAALSAGRIVQSVFTALEEFTRGVPYEDDITLVVVKAEG
jgi:sigma-B regulation protein RsbU (phosphoserine phosphatase)